MLQTGGSAEMLAEHSHHQTSALWCNNAEATEAILVVQSTLSSLCGENRGQHDFHLQLCAESSACLAMLILKVLARLKLQNNLMEFLEIGYPE
jgi:hypothetical protein